jgi:hypothetical protein
MLKRVGTVLVLACAAGTLASMCGCLERRMTITSDPPGASVTVNDVEVGRTPVTASFVYFGTYQVELEREGYEPVRAKAKARTPVYEYPPIDLLASAFPANITSNVKFHYVLEPENSKRQSEQEADAALVQRAHELRKQVQ